MSALTPTAVAAQPLPTVIMRIPGTMWLTYEEAAPPIPGLSAPPKK
jgi:hypothetical protein